MDYWRYYEDDFDWTMKGEIRAPSSERAVQVLGAAGVSPSEAKEIFDSGYICFSGHDVVVDRFYGGMLVSPNLKNRFPAKVFVEVLRDKTPRSRAWLRRARSLEELRDIVQAEEQKASGIVFRGQTRHHRIDRRIANPFYLHEELGETSLLPSLWRRMYAKGAGHFTEFRNLSMLEWSSILYSPYDAREIAERQVRMFEKGETFYTMQDFEDSDDEVLKKFGQLRLDLTMGYGYNLGPLLATLLQHYGLLSPVLDLTESLDVALFFATHKYGIRDGKSRYDFIGANGGRSVIYFLKQDALEMARHDGRERILEQLDPQRPIRQRCVISGSDPCAINLPADFLLGAVFLDFEIGPSEVPDCAALFPAPSEDRFLKAMVENLFRKEFLTVF